MTTWTDLVEQYGNSGAWSICTIAQTFLNAGRGVKLQTALQWAIEQYEEAQLVKATLDSDGERA